MRALSRHPTLSARNALILQAIQKKVSRVDIGKEFGLKPNTIDRIVRDYNGAKFKKRLLSKQQKSAIRSARAKGTRITALIAKYKVNRKTIFRIVRGIS